MSVKRLLLPAIAGYVRRCPIEKGKWRLANTSKRWTRALGKITDIRTIRTKNGFRMRLNLADWVDQHIYAIGDYEPEVVEMAKLVLNDGDVAIDIGANIGYFSLLFASLVGAQGRVIAFEPQPEVHRRLRENLSLNPSFRIEAMEVAAADKEGVLEFHCGPDHHSGVGSLRNRRDGEASIKVKTCRADDILPPEMQVRLIKIDVEGAEVNVISGLERTLKRWHPELLIEVSDEYLSQMGTSGQQLFQRLQAHGYQMFRLHHEEIEHVDQWSDDLPTQFNALFSARENIQKNILSRHTASGS